MSWFSDALGWFTGKSIGANLARVAVLGYLTKLLNKNVGNGGGGEDIVDQGVRLQLTPSTDNKIPVLYGEAYFGGYITDAYLSEDYKKMTYVLTLAETTGNLLSTSSASAYTFNGVYFNNNRVVFKADGVTVDYTLDSSGNQDIAFRDLVKVYFYAAGTGIQPTGSSGTTPASDTVVPGWDDTNYPMSGLMYAVVEVTYSRANNVTGLPECTFHVTNSMTLPGDVLNDYITNDRYGAGLTSTDIDNSLATLNTFCAAGFTYTDAAAEQQTGVISINGLVDTNTDVLTNMEALAAAGSAWMSYDIHAGKWSAIINRAGSSTASMTDSHIVGEISVGGTSLTALHNAADVKFQNTDILDKTDFAKINLPTEDLFQNELPNVMQIALPFTNKQNVAIKLGAQMLKQARVDKMISFTTDYSFLNVRAGDLIDVTSPVYGYTNKVFRVISAQEEEGEDATILIRFQCLEYDAAVYDFDVQEYEIETEDGILSVGAIGKPDTPVVQTIQQSNTPRINIIAEVPSGIVDAMEFWITFDTSIPNDADRAYIQIGTFSNPDGSPLTENQSITYTYSQLSQSNFFVKVRGVNNIASGPYSDPTGLVAYVPVVVADSIGDVQLSVGGQLMSLGILTLLNNLDSLLDIFSGEKNIQDAIKEIFFPGSDPEKTAAEILKEDAEFIAAVGEQTADVGSYSINALQDVDTASYPKANGYVLAYKNGNWVPVDISECCDVEDKLPADPVDPPDPPQCYLSITSRLPPDRSDWQDPLNNITSEQAPLTGSYFITFGDTKPFYAPLDIGVGYAYLYKSDGTLVESVEAGDFIIRNNLVEIPFAPRQAGIDYYILLDEGVVEHCTTCISPAITVGQWNFNTPKFAVAEYDPSDPALDIYEPPTYDDVIIEEVVPNGTNLCRTTKLILRFSEDIAVGSGSVYIKQNSTIVHQFDASDATITANEMDFGFITNYLNLGSSYTIEVDAGIAVSDRPTLTGCGYSYEPPQDNSIAYNSSFSIQGPLLLSSYQTFKKITGGYEVNTTEADIETNIRLIFNRAVFPGPNDPIYVKIYDENNNLHQQINVYTNFAEDQTNELIKINGAQVDINPTLDFITGTSYYMLIDTGAFKDSCNENFAGVATNDVITWTTRPGPSLSSTVPASGSTGSINDTGIVLNLDGNIIKGYANVNIKDGGTIVSTITPDDITLS